MTERQPHSDDEAIQCGFLQVDPRGFSSALRGLTCCSLLDTLRHNHQNVSILRSIVGCLLCLVAPWRAGTEKRPRLGAAAAISLRTTLMEVSAYANFFGHLRPADLSGH
jgi:hypothetical protein